MVPLPLIWFFEHVIKIVRHLLIHNPRDSLTNEDIHLSLKWVQDRAISGEEKKMPHRSPEFSASAQRT